MEISVRVTANARKPSIREENGAYFARVDAPAIGGKANARLIEMLAERFGVPGSHIRIIKGTRSRDKRVSIGV